MIVYIVFLLTTTGAIMDSVADVSFTPQSLGQANFQFNFDLLKEFYKSGGTKITESNIIFSSFSIGQVMSMILLGARGSTFDQLIKALHYKSNPAASERNQKALHKTIWNLISSLKSSANVTLDISNAGYPSQKFELNGEFIRDASTYYDATWQKLDFANDPSRAAAIINGNVENATRGKIKDLIPKSALGAQTVLVLTNAIYFKGTWKMAFDKETTTHVDFYPDDGSTQKVKVMQDTRDVLHSTSTVSGLKVEAIELPYSNIDIVMLYVMPPKGTIKKLISFLSPTVLKEIRKGLVIKKTDLSLPILESATDIDLKAYLSQLGFSNLFSSAADLSGIARSGGAKLAVSEVFHKAFISINEEGTEAAAATGAIVMFTSLQFNNEFRVDRPFLYFLLHKPSGTILFSGTFVKG